MWFRPLPGSLDPDEHRRDHRCIDVIVYLVPEAASEGEALPCDGSGDLLPLVNGENIFDVKNSLLPVSVRGFGS